MTAGFVATVNGLVGVNGFGFPHHEFPFRHEAAAAMAQQQQQQQMQQQQQGMPGSPGMPQHAMGQVMKGI